MCAHVCGGGRKRGKNDKKKKKGKRERKERKKEKFTWRVLLTTGAGMDFRDGRAT